MSIQTIRRNIKYWFQRRIRGWSDDETWNLDYSFMKWINSRFKKYKKLASKIVDLTYYKFVYKNKEYTQIELIDKILELSNEYLKADWLDIKKDKIKDEIFDIFKLIYWHMWW